VDRATSEGEDKVDVANGNTRTQDPVAVSRDGEADAASHVVQRRRLAAEESASSVQDKQVSLLLICRYLNNRAR